MYPSLHGGGQGLYGRQDSGPVQQQQFYGHVEGPGRSQAVTCSSIMNMFQGRLVLVRALRC